MRLSSVLLEDEKEDWFKRDHVVPFMPGSMFYTMRGREVFINGSNNIELKNIKSPPWPDVTMFITTPNLKFDSTCLLKSLNGIEKFVKFNRFGGILFEGCFSDDESIPMLSLLRIKHLGEIYFYGSSAPKRFKELEAIFNKALVAGYDVRDKLIDVQHELIEHGFDKYAEL